MSILQFYEAIEMYFQVSLDHLEISKKVGTLMDYVNLIEKNIGESLTKIETIQKLGNLDWHSNTKVLS